MTPGGRYECRASDEMKEYMPDMPDVIVDGEVVEVDPPNRLVQTYRMHFEPAQTEEGFTTVTWEIHAESDDLCRLTVTHDVTDAPGHGRHDHRRRFAAARAAVAGPGSSATSRPCWRPARPNEL